MMKVSTPKTNQTNVGSYKTDCLTECDCLAYSCGVTNCKGASNESCLKWSYEITNLQEEYSEGLTIFVRSTISDIGKSFYNQLSCFYSLLQHLL